MSRKGEIAQSGTTSPKPANGRKARTGSDKPNPFAQFELNKDQHDELRAKMSADPLWLDEATHELIEAGHKITFKWDNFTDCPTAWVFAPTGDPDNADMIMSGRGSTAFKALAEAVFKVYLLQGNAWPKFVRSNGYIPWDE